VDRTDLRISTGRRHFVRAQLDVQRQGILSIRAGRTSTSAHLPTSALRSERKSFRQSSFVAACIHIIRQAVDFDLIKRRKHGSFPVWCVVVVSNRNQAHLSFDFQFHLHCPCCSPFSVACSALPSSFLLSSRGSSLNRPNCFRSNMHFDTHYLRFRPTPFFRIVRTFACRIKYTNPLVNFDLCDSTFRIRSQTKPRPKMCLHSNDLNILFRVDFDPRSFGHVVARTGNQTQIRCNLNNYFLDSASLAKAVGSGWAIRHWHDSEKICLGSALFLLLCEYLATFIQFFSSFRR
jgi:hypothetical protein